MTNPDVRLTASTTASPRRFRVSGCYGAAVVTEIPFPLLASPTKG